VVEKFPQRNVIQRKIKLQSWFKWSI